MFLRELVCQIVHQHIVEVIAAQVRITVGRQYFEYAVAEFQNGYIEGAAAKVVYQDLVGAFFFVKTVGQRRRSRFVDDSLDIQTRDSARVLGCLLLRVGEVSRYGDNRFGYLLTEVSLCVVL